MFEPKVIKFRTGRRCLPWNKSCIAIGLSASFIEPLESTTIYLISSNLLRLVRLFPSYGIDQLTINEFNRQASDDLEVIRDFVVMHFHCTRCTDTEFWRYCGSMTIPESLKRRLECTM